MREPVWLTVADVVAFNEAVVADTGEPHFLREPGLLESALNRAPQLFHYGDPTIFDLAAAYVGGIDRAQAFLNGNKRTAFVAAVAFLELNGFDFVAPDSAKTAQVFLDFAARNLSESDLAAWLQRHSRSAAD